MFCIKGAGLEKTSLAKVVGIFNKVKENKKFEPGNTRETPGKHPGNTRETPGKHPGKVHSLMFCIKGAGLEKNFFIKSCGDF